ncbi:MAG: beta-N-acetylhexosaminidase, partial [Pirellulales bacterium]|nr:beta-N-acetylhexosaminidase [Pirellulales bacterium]
MRACKSLSVLILVFLEIALVASPEGFAWAVRNGSFDLLLPAPHEVQVGTGEVVLGIPIRLSAPEPWKAAVGRSLWLLNEVLESRRAGPVAIAKKTSGAAIHVVRKPKGDMPENGYELTIAGGAIELAASDLGGVFNGLTTLAQLLELGSGGAVRVPNGRIRDWPELPTRAVHIDMTCQQYSAAYVQKLMRILARYKVNAILMEYSDMFPFREHKAICRPDA